MTFLVTICTFLIFFMNDLQHRLIAYFFGYTFEKIHTFYDLKVCLLDPLNFDFFVCSTF